MPGNTKLKAIAHWVWNSRMFCVHLESNSSLKNDRLLLQVTELILQIEQIISMNVSEIWSFELYKHHQTCVT